MNVRFPEVDWYISSIVPRTKWEKEENQRRRKEKYCCDIFFINVLAVQKYRSLSQICSRLANAVAYMKTRSSASCPLI